MEFRDVVRRRRMVRRFDPLRPVEPALVQEVVRTALRAPSAGFSQGWDFLVMADPDSRRRFWDATSPADRPADRWLTGVSSAPVLVLCLSHPQAYLDRYAEPDKGWTDRDPGRWPVPYWDVDTGMAALLMLLTAVDQGLGALFFGVPGEVHDDVRRTFDIPADRRLVGVVALGYEKERATSPSLRRGRRPTAEVVHWGRFGASGAGPV